MLLAGRSVCQPVPVRGAAATGPKALSSNTMDGYERVYRRALEYVAVAAGLEAAAPGGDPTAAEEVRAAVESVFPLASLARYLTLTTAEKTQQARPLKGQWEQTQCSAVDDERSRCLAQLLLQHSCRPLPGVAAHGTTSAEGVQSSQSSQKL
jgi:hypothetical protein